jgi:hypothetical protein
VPLLPFRAEEIRHPQAGIGDDLFKVTASPAVQQYPAARADVDAERGVAVVMGGAQGIPTVPGLSDTVEVIQDVFDVGVLAVPVSKVIFFMRFWPVFLGISLEIQVVIWYSNNRHGFSDRVRGNKRI